MLSMKQPTFATSSWWRTGTSAKFAMSSGALHHVSQHGGQRGALAVVVLGGALTT